MTRAAAVLALCLLVAAPAAAQIALGRLDADPAAPVEVTAERLSVDQATGRAVFEGGVVIGQGALRIAADRVEVIYDSGSERIVRLRAEGSVTFVTPTAQAEAQSAEYDIDAGVVALSGDVLLSQETGAIAADRMIIDIAAGTARAEGQVRTILGSGGG